MTKKNKTIITMLILASLLTLGICFQSKSDKKTIQIQQKLHQIEDRDEMLKHE